MATHSRILAWRIAWTEEPEGLQSEGSQRVGHDWSDLTRTHIHWVFWVTSLKSGKAEHNSQNNHPDHPPLQLTLDPTPGVTSYHQRHVGVNHMLMAYRATSWYFLSDSITSHLKSWRHGNSREYAVPGLDIYIYKHNIYMFNVYMFNIYTLNIIYIIYMYICKM